MSDTCFATTKIFLPAPDMEFGYGEKHRAFVCACSNPGEINPFCKEHGEGVVELLSPTASDILKVLSDIALSGRRNEQVTVTISIGDCEIEYV